MKTIKAQRPTISAQRSSSSYLIRKCSDQYGSISILTRYHEYLEKETMAYHAGIGMQSFAVFLKYHRRGVCRRSSSDCGPRKRIELCLPLEITVRITHRERERRDRWGRQDVGIISIFEGR